MKKVFVYVAILTSLGAVLSCGQEHEYFKGLTSNVSAGSVQVKFIHAASDTVGVNLFADNFKITGNAATVITTSGAPNEGQINVGTVTFQNAFPVTNYTAIPNGGVFTAVVPDTYTATVKYAAKTLATVNAPSLSGNYTFAFVGVTKAYELVYVPDDLSAAPIDGNAYVRFANFIPNNANPITIKATPPADPSPAPAPTPITLASSIAYKSVSNFIALPKVGTYTNISIYDAVTNTLITTLASTSAFNSFTNNKAYTIFARGQMGKSGTPAPGISRVTNR